MTEAQILFKKINDEMNYNMGHADGKSKLGSIQEAITDLKFLTLKGKNLSPSEAKSDLDSFEANLFSNPNMFDSNIDYSSVRGVNAHFNAKKNEFIQSMSYEDTVGERRMSM